MSIKFAILDMLSWKSFTGYELKKFFEESSSMYWSGNNNQIYKTLIQLQDEELVTSEVVHQESLHSKKIYTITEEGLIELKEWVMSTPEVPEYKKPFLIQLAGSDLLSNQELNELLSKYENEVKVELLMQQEKSKRAALNSPNRNTREIFLWNMISKNIISSCKNELDWVQEVRQKLFEKLDIEERNKMNYQIKETSTEKYIELFSTASPLNTENDALDLIALCSEVDTNLLILHLAALSEDFFNLKTGVAGKIIQKFVNYRIKVAVIIPDETAIKGKFKDMVIEANRNNHFRIFENILAAEKWLLE